MIDRARTQKGRLTNRAESDRLRIFSPARRAPAVVEAWASAPRRAARGTAPTPTPQRQAGRPALAAQTVIGETDPASLFVGGSRVGGSRCYLALGGFPATPAHVTYPFMSPLTGAAFDRSVLPWSGRSEPYDVSVDGVAHVGMIPDFVEELRTLGLSDEGLAPLWSGAEAYIGTWENAQEVVRQLYP